MDDDPNQLDARIAVAFDFALNREYRPSTLWADGGPLIERYHIHLRHSSRHREWEATIFLTGDAEWIQRYGPTPLIAAMRCLAAYLHLYPPARDDP